MDLNLVLTYVHNTGIKISNYRIARTIFMNKMLNSYLKLTLCMPMPKAPQHSLMRALEIIKLVFN